VKLFLILINKKNLEKNPIVINLSLDFLLVKFLKKIESYKFYCKNETYEKYFFFYFKKKL